MNIEEWKKKYEKIGKDCNYSELEIKDYGCFINFLYERAKVLGEIK